jgi:hypothetical protein
MKKQVTYLVTFLLMFLPLLASGQQKTVDEKKKAEQEQQIKKQEEELRRKQAEMEKQLELMNEEQLIRAEEIEKAMEAARLNYNIGSSGVNWVTASPDGRLKAFYSQSPNSTSVDYSRRLQESTLSKDFIFDVEKDAKKANISVSGSCEDGEIRIQIILPSGKQYTEVLIDRYGSVNWNKSFSIDDPKDEKIGKWKFVITTKEATGTFRIGLRSN